MKRFFQLFFIGLLIISLIACGNEENVHVEDEEVDLIIYSGHSENLTTFYVKEFQEKTGLQVKAVIGSGAEIIDLVKDNKEKLPGDIIIGVGSDSLNLNNDMFTDYSSIHFDKIDDDYNHEDKKWIGDFRIPMVIIYNKQTVSEEDIPKSWLDLLNNKFKGQIAMGDPTISGSTYTQLVTLLTVFGQDDQAWDFIEKLAHNMNGMTLANTLDVPLKVHEGEYMLGITLESYAYEYLQHNSNLGFVYPIEGTTARTSGIAVLENAPHIENAKKFIDFVLDPKTEEVVAENFYRRPTHKDVEDPIDLEDSEDIHFIDYDYQWASTYFAQNLKIWEDIFSQIRETNGD